MPRVSALIWFSIFIASSTRIAWPTVDRRADRDEHLARSCPASARSPCRRRPRAPELVRRRASGRARPAAGAAAATGASGSHTCTEKRRPSTSTGTVRSTSCSPVVRRPPVRRRRRRPRRRELRGVHFVLDPLRRVARRAEVVVREQHVVRGDRRVHAFDLELVERAEHALDRAVAVGCPHDELADEVVVVLRDRVALVVAAVPAHARARTARAAA